MPEDQADSRQLIEELAARWRMPDGDQPMIAARIPRRTPPVLSSNDKTVSRCSFAKLVLLHVRLSGFEPDDRDVCQWVESYLPLIEDQGQDPARWARAYMLAVGLQQ
jgi:hypothetical protein